jgi:ribosome-binding protein aMBF1 (putative translation factor)
VLTVEAGRPSSADTTPVPPNRSMTASDDGNMDTLIVRRLRTCQVFAPCETTGTQKNDGIGIMAETVRDIANRLIRTRLALGFQSQAEFAKAIDLEKNVYNPFERGKRRLTLEAARKIKRRFGVSLDWLFDGDISTLSNSLSNKIGRAA